MRSEHSLLETLKQKIHQGDDEFIQFIRTLNRQELSAAAVETDENGRTLLHIAAQFPLRVHKVFRRPGDLHAGNSM